MYHNITHLTSHLGFLTSKKHPAPEVQCLNCDVSKNHTEGLSVSYAIGIPTRVPLCLMP